MNKCEKCGFLHYRTDPCRKPNKSTAPSESKPSRSRSANENLSVDTNPEQRGRREAKANNREVQDPVQEKSANLTRGVTAGETASKFDKKTWMRDYMREHRRGIRRRAAK